MTTNNVHLQLHERLESRKSLDKFAWNLTFKKTWWCTVWLVSSSYGLAGQNVALRESTINLVFVLGGSSTANKSEMVLFLGFFVTSSSKRRFFFHFILNEIFYSQVRRWWNGKYRYNYRWVQTPNRFIFVVEHWSITNGSSPPHTV